MDPNAQSHQGFTIKTSKFGSVSQFIESIHNEADESPRSIPEVFVERLKRVIDADEFSHQELEDVLCGKRKLKPNGTSEKDGQKNESDKIISECKKWRYGEKWLLVSAATTEEERKQRDSEFGHFKKESKIPEEDITECRVEGIGHFLSAMKKFITDQKKHNRPLNIIIIGHGDCHKTKDGEIIPGSGQLTMLESCEKGSKISIENRSIVDMVGSTVHAADIGNTTVRLCLFYCYAHETNLSMIENVGVLTYKGNKNPDSLIDNTHGEQTDTVVSVNTALRWLLKYRDNMEEESLYDSLLQRDSVSVGIGAGETTVTKLNSDEDCEEDKGPVDSTALCCEPCKVPDGYSENPTDGPRNARTNSTTSVDGINLESGQGEYPGKTSASLQDNQETSSSSRMLKNVETGSSDREKLTVAVEEKLTVDVSAEGQQERHPPEDARQGWRSRAWVVIVRSATTFLDMYPKM